VATVANFRVIRVDRVDLPHLNLGPVEVGNFEVPAEATRHPALLSLMVSPRFDMAMGADMRFGVDLNGRQLLDDRIRTPGARALLTHRRSPDEFEIAVTALSLVIPVDDPPWLKTGVNTLELRETHMPEVDVGSNGVTVSDVVLWFQQSVA
jgi:hypothetical protein